MAKILIIDDDPGMVQVISDLCAKAGHSTAAFNSGQRALDALSSQRPDVIVSDVRMEGVTGLDVLHSAKISLPQAQVILITGSKSPESAVQAMRAGAPDYILKPFKIDDLVAAIERSLAAHSEDAPVPRIPPPVPTMQRSENIIGHSERMQDVFKLVEKISNSESTVLITGESGTGKELVARALHYKSQRSGRPFIAINCSALPENLLESELFGHKKGSFTGAVLDKVGLFEEAEGGTVFLDEINSMAPLLQTKLLRVLQERTVRRVGDNHIIPIHVRVLAASNEPLHEKIKTGAFRQDLYYRLAVITVEMPPLRERREDIPLLVSYFLNKHHHPAQGDPPLRIDAAALNALSTYRWPGNVRELENAVERACVLCEKGVVHLHDLPPHVVQPPVLELHNTETSAGEAMELLNSVTLPVGITLDDFISVLESRFVEETVRFNHGVRERAAHMLGISTATLYRKMDNDKKTSKKNAPEAR